MTNPAPSRVRPAPRTTAIASWTAVRRAIFLDMIGHGTNVAAATRGAGMSRQSAYALRDRDPAFAAEWDGLLQAREQRLLASYTARCARRDAHLQRIAAPAPAPAPGPAPAATPPTLATSPTPATRMTRWPTATSPTPATQGGARRA